MSTLFFRTMGPPAPSPENEATVRSTVTWVDNADQPAEMTHAPDFNESVGDQDHDTQGGLTDRNLASKVIPSQRYVPNVAQSAQDDHNAIIDRQVSTSGIAAALESMGLWGHGTMKVVEGIEPDATLRDNGKLGDDYFTVGGHQIDISSGKYMTPSVTADQQTRGEASVQTQIAPRQAVQASMYQQ